MSNIINILLVGAAGFIGAILRYLTTILLNKSSKGFLVPLGTLGVNLIGCLLIGVLGGLADNLQILSPRLRLFLIVGLLGGFTTFSAFGYETITLLKNREMAGVFLNIGAHVILGLFFVYFGYSLSTIKT